MNLNYKSNMECIIMIFLTKFRYTYSRSIYSVGVEKEGSKSAFAEANWQLALDANWQIHSFYRAREKLSVEKRVIWAGQRLIIL